VLCHDGVGGGRALDVHQDLIARVLGVVSLVLGGGGGYGGYRGSFIVVK
jgi:hypothetical protein